MSGVFGGQVRIVIRPGQISMITSTMKIDWKTNPLGNIQDHPVVV